MPHYHHLTKSIAQRGFTLIEVLVAALVLAIGILGLATAMLTGLKSDKSAYFRSQASTIAYDMADRMRLNKTSVDSYVGLDTNDATPAANTCITNSSGCSPANLVNVDFREWKANFSNVFGLTKYAPMLPNGRGVITQDGAGRYVITITWQEDDWNANPDDTSERSAKDQTLILNLTL